MWQSKWISLILCLSLLVGCSAVPSLKQRLIVEGLAVDYEQNGYSVTAQVYSSGETPPFRLYTGHGDSVYRALQDIDDRAGKPAYFSDVKVIVFSQKALSRGLWQCLGYFVRSSQFGNALCLAATKEKAKDLFSVVGTGGRQPSGVLSDVLRMGAKSTEACGELKQVVADLSTPGASATLPLLSLKKQKNAVAVTDGVLCFWGDKPSQTLSGEAVEVFRLLRGYANGRPLTVTVKGTWAALEYKTVSSHISASWHDHAPGFTVSIKAKCILKQTDSPLYPTKQLSDVENAAQIALKEAVERTLMQTVQKDKTDVFGCIQAVRKSLPSRYFTAQHPEALFAGAAFQCNAKVTVVRVEQGALS